MVTKPGQTNEGQAYAARLWWAVQPQWLWRLVRLTLRCFWIAATTAAVGWLATRALGLAAPLPAWLGGGFALFMLLLPLVALWPVPLARLARRVDQAFGLGDRVTTAREIAARAPQNYMEGRLLTATHHLLGTVRARLLRAPRVPWVDLELSALAVLALYGVYLLSGPTPPRTPDIPPTGYEALAPLADEVQVPLPGDPGQAVAPADAAGQTVDPAAAQQVLDALAEALSENSVTETAGAALAQGDTDRAADALRELADAADELSQSTRDALAQSLREAAAETRDTAPDAAEQIQATADALAGGDASEASIGLEDLAQLIEDLDTAREPGQGTGAGDSGQGQGAGSGSGDSTGRETQTEGTTERLEAASEPVELPEDELPADEAGVLQPPDHTSTATDQRDTPYTHTGATGAGGDNPADPLSFPWRLKHVVQRYFSPD